MFKNWEVGSDGHYYYVYDMSMDEIKEEFDIQDPNFKFIDKNDWTAENYAEILGNELEDANYHNWTELPHIILSALEKTNLSKEEMDLAMREIVESIYKMI